VTPGLTLGTLYSSGVGINKTKQHYETNTSDWRCQDCGGPQRHADCALSDNGQVVQQHVGSSLPSSGYPALGDGDVVAGEKVYTVTHRKNSEKLSIS